MWKYLDNLRQQPRPVRQTAAFWGAAIFTLVVVGVWSLSLPERIVSIVYFTDKPVFEPESQLMANFRDLGASLRAAVVGHGELSGTSSPTPTSTAQYVYEIDLTELQATNTPTSSPSAASSSARVWARGYEKREGGRPILIATTTRATTIQNE